MYRPGDARDHILRASRPFDIGKEKDPVLALEPSTEFLRDAGLAHASLSRQQHVIAVTNPCLQDPQFAVSTEEVIAGHPAASG